MDIVPMTAVTIMRMATIIMEMAFDLSATSATTRKRGGKCVSNCISGG
jgi:hypothetical protein